MHTSICQISWLISNWLLVSSLKNAPFRWQVPFHSLTLHFFLTGLYTHDNKLMGRRFTWKQVSERKKQFFLTKPLLNSPEKKRHAQVTTEEIDTVWSTSFVLVITGLCVSSRVMHQASVFLKPQGQFVFTLLTLSGEAVKPTGSREF